ncbi:MAG: hypothetical protein ABJF23_32315 [Bryobacteraceae bacterium]
MRRRIQSIALVLLAGGIAQAATKAEPSTGEVEKIITAFADKESEFAKARENYTYRQSAKLQEFDEGGSPGGRYEIVSDIVFTNEGKRTEHVVKAPPNTLRLIQMSPADEQDLRNVLPFVLTSKDIDNYHVRYLGRQNADEIPCYVFAVKPKSMEQGKRYFTGEIWVDEQDLMIVKSYGRATGLLKKGSDEQFPKFETYREQIDGKYWFPTYTIANSTLHFKDSSPRVKQSVKYEDYKQFRSQSTITFGDQTAPKTEPKDPKKP